MRANYFAVLARRAAVVIGALRFRGWQFVYLIRPDARIQSWVGLGGLGCEQQPKQAGASSQQQSFQEHLRRVWLVITGTNRGSGAFPSNFLLAGVVAIGNVFVRCGNAKQNKTTKGKD